MDYANSKIKFYSLGSEKLDFTKLSSINIDKPVFVSKGFSKALNNVINKDIELLENNMNKVVKEINKLLIINNISDIKFNEKIENVDGNVNKLEEAISRIIIEKENIKVGFFTSNKKDKKQRQTKLESCFNSLSKYQSELISMRDEYNKLMTRKNTVKEDVYCVEEEMLEETNPIERTVSFYMNKEKEK